ncbi:MAG: ribonuclease D [Proteobacteria bacterium]|nr:MAG: ribonuclease D [Pseudomonadota bacterium]
MTIHLHHGDLPDGLKFPGGAAIAVDTETLGLNLTRDRLCLVQLSADGAEFHLVKIAAGQPAAPNLKRLLEDPARLKIFHYARFDLAMLKRGLGIAVGPVYCTKVASRLVRTYTDRHGLKDLCRELLDVDLSKQQQSSNWGADALSEAQLAYAAADVQHLHALRAKLDDMLARTGRDALAAACFAFLPTRAELDLAGWGEEDIFSH